MKNLKKFAVAFSAAALFCQMSGVQALAGAAVELPLSVATPSDAVRTEDGYDVATASDARTKEETVETVEETKAEEPEEINKEETASTEAETATPSNATKKEVVCDSEWVVLPKATRDGYTFVEWNTEPDGTGTGFAAGEAIQITDEILYAVWEEDDEAETADKENVRVASSSDAYYDEDGELQIPDLEILPE